MTEKDFLEEHIEEWERKTPGFKEKVEAANNRRVLNRKKENRLITLKKSIADYALENHTFTGIFREAVDLLFIPTKLVADTLHISQETVTLWMVGKNLPHRDIRKLILMGVCLAVTERLENDT